MCTTETPSLQQLTKLTILPSRSSQLSTPLTFLDKIDHIEINDTSERNGVVFYRIAVFLKHNTSHIPTIKSTAVSDQPDYQIERRFTDFANLRYNVWMYAQRQHDDGRRCKYCGEFMSYIVHSLSQPRALIKLATGVHTRKKLLTSFCNAFIIKALARKEHFRSLCTGYQTIPHIMEDFFRQVE
ncbi:hypothetical protein PC129_g12216 [Phytophthora cactorum]|uniref:PX domain-containing protein n=1 Tax=Phytophthora cactorum TaxID=29920 RepID=A0A329RWX1_9STRA|nr:hypothetical protein GQ600_6847 [Phytophthora cactorum]KAG2777720.1 hypothetical protein Pcac1_g11902 [Phytophthora cactorum]KAG2823504.1 hypothetical protein PC111_g10202 [Phytophthora cactorum]KAG2844959.1 hypothetical protein PC112_g2019 [Phytophthora cactorum]KAG2867244.1 hypothetical protein PC113_g2141 [Phytophthora cactorum]